jgi:outer membrane protein assembly factor BamA
VNRVRFWFVVTALALVGSGCGTSPEEKIVGRQFLIDIVEMEGVTRFSERELLRHLHIGETLWVPFTPDYNFHRATLAVDALRIERLYKAHGYYRAQVNHLEFEVDEEEEEVRIVLRVEEGPPVKVEKVNFVWEAADDLTPGERLAVQELSGFATGDHFEIPVLNDAIGSMRLSLLQRGFPAANVISGTDVIEGALRADVTYTLRAGPRAKIGSIVIDGLHDVPAYMVEREVRFAVGQTYSPGIVAQVESAINGMRVFRWVAASPTASMTNDGTMELRIRVSEAEPQTLKLGTALQFEAARWEELLVGKYTHTNLFGHLTRLDLNVAAGYAELPDPFSPDAHGPVLKVVPAFTKKGLFEEYLVWTERPAFTLDIQEGYQYYSPSNRLGVARWFAGFIRGDVSHNLRLVDFYNRSPELAANKSVLGRDFRDPFTLSYLELQADFHFVDSINSPQNGAVFELAYDLAGGVLQGDYAFQKVDGAVRTYWRPFERLQLAARLQTGLILPYGETGGAPITFQYYLGGANTVRGWGSRKLSPRLEECTGEDGTDCKSIPVGGYTLIQGNLEARFLLGGGFWLVGFVDAGDVQDEANTYKVAEWNYSAGPGLRFDSPVGLFRLDAGFRLNDPGVYQEPPWSLYFGLGEAF